MVAIACVMLVDQVEWVPFPVIGFRVCFRSAVRVESLIQQVVDVEIEYLLETFTLHVFSTKNEK